MLSSANCTADSDSDVKSSPMPTQTRTKTKPTPRELVELKNLLPLLARLIESEKISIRLGPIADVKDWLNNYQAFEKSPIVTIDANSVRLVGTELQIDCGLDDYTAQLNADYDFLAVEPRVNPSL
jgi:hypothetical protein